MRIHIFFSVCFGVVCISKAAADDPMTALMGKQGLYPGNPDLCKQMIARVRSGVDIAAIQSEQLTELNHAQLQDLAWHVGIYKKACNTVAMSRNRPELWNKIERIRTELKTAKPKQMRNSKQYQSPEQDAYGSIFERKAQLSNV